MDSATEDFLSFAWDAYTRDVGHPPGWDWRERVDALRIRDNETAEENKRLRARIASLIRCHGKRVEMALPKADEMTFIDPAGEQ